MTALSLTGPRRGKRVFRTGLLGISSSPSAAAITVPKSVLRPLTPFSRTARLPRLCRSYRVPVRVPKTRTSGLTTARLTSCQNLERLRPQGQRTLAPWTLGFIEVTLVDCFGQPLAPGPASRNAFARRAVSLTSGSGSARQRLRSSNSEFNRRVPIA
jgi:hypothetical protein